MMKWRTTRSPGGVALHVSGDYQIESYRRPSFRGHVASGYTAPSVALYYRGQNLGMHLSVSAAKARAERHDAEARS